MEERGGEKGLGEVANGGRGTSNKMGVLRPEGRVQRRSADVGYRIAVAVGIIQTILLAAHVFLYQTLLSFAGPLRKPWDTVFAATLGMLSVSFVAGTLLAHRYFNGPVRWFYRVASLWLGVLNFAFVAACLSWITLGAARVAGIGISREAIAAVYFSLALAASVYGIANAASVRVRRVRVKLPGLPQSWKGRAAALVTDTHLGHIIGPNFVTRLVNMLRQLRADVVFISGDLFDGTKVDPDRLVAPWKHLTPKFGSYFVTGNHDEFSDPKEYLDAIRGTGIRVLDNEKVNLDGLQVVGVPYHDSANAERFRTALQNAKLDPERASVLLSHVPHGLSIAEQEGISLQLSGHTHGGQMFPFTWFTSRIFGPFTYGLEKHGDMQVYTSSGAGTWGPPMRVGTQPEIVLIQFE